MTQYSWVCRIRGVSWKSMIWRLQSREPFSAKMKARKFRESTARSKCWRRSWKQKGSMKESTQSSTWPTIITVFRGETVSLLQIKRSTCSLRTSVLLFVKLQRYYRVIRRSPPLWPAIERAVRVSTWDDLYIYNIWFARMEAGWSKPRKIFHFDTLQDNSKETE